MYSPMYFSNVQSTNIKDNQYGQTMLPLLDLINGKQCQNLIAYTRSNGSFKSSTHNNLGEYSLITTTSTLSPEQ